jgi:hypothetical protein
VYAPGRAGPGQEQELDSQQEVQHRDTFSSDREVAAVAPPALPEEEGLAEGAYPEPGLASNAGERRSPQRERIPVASYLSSAYLAEDYKGPTLYRAAVDGPQAPGAADIGHGRLATTLKISQPRHAEGIKARLNMEESKPKSVHMAARAAYLKIPCGDDEPLDGHQVRLYGECVHALQQLASEARPDLASTVSFLARYTSLPCVRHWQLLEDVLRYVKATQTQGIEYGTSQTQLGVYIHAHDAGAGAGAYAPCRGLQQQGTARDSWSPAQATMQSAESRHCMAKRDAAWECMAARAWTAR